MQLQGSNQFGHKNLIKIFSILAVFIFIAIAFPSFAQDATGANTGTLNDVTAATAGKPTVYEISATAGHNKLSINIMWTLLCCFLLMFMQADFELFERSFTKTTKF